MATARALDDDTLPLDTAPRRRMQPTQPGTENAANTWPFRCASCGFAARASLEGLEATTDATSAVPDAAAEGPADAARSSVQLAACPKCSVRSDDAVRLYLRARIAPALTYGVLGGLLGTLGTCAARGSSDSLDVVSGAVIAGILAAATFVLPTWRKLAGTRKVRFAPTEEVDTT